MLGVAAVATSWLFIVQALHFASRSLDRMRALALDSVIIVKRDKTLPQNSDATMN